MPLDLETRFARRRLAFLPSPLQKLERLSEVLGVEVWAKRDDVSSGLAYGGNKVRKMEWLVADALAKGCDTLVSIGGVQSNHTRQVAAVAAACGMKCRLVQEHWAEWDDPVYDKVGNILLSRLMGAKAVLEGAGYSTAVKETWEAALEEVRRDGGTPYAVPAGASDHPLGGLGYANFADELAAQEAEMGIFFDTVITATCTGSTQAGMVVGFKAQDRPRRLIGVDTAANEAMTRAAVTKIARATAELIGLEREIEDQDIIVEPRFCGPGLAAEGALEPGSRVLYVHLGGAPALDAYHKAFE
jgi:1-aminocyclopropane-1-carboxylate deaminase